jgi:hypothetical protein
VSTSSAFSHSGHAGISLPSRLEHFLLLLQTASVAFLCGKATGIATQPSTAYSKMLQDNTYD